MSAETVVPFSAASLLTVSAAVVLMLMHNCILLSSSGTAPKMVS